MTSIPGPPTDPDDSSYAYEDDDVDGGNASDRSVSTTDFTGSAYTAPLVCFFLVPELVGFSIPGNLPV
jgi:hypothetical protein